MILKMSQSDKSVRENETLNIKPLTIKRLEVEKTFFVLNVFWVFF